MVRLPFMSDPRHEHTALAIDGDRRPRELDLMAFARVSNFHTWPDRQFYGVDGHWSKKTDNQ
jgi:hypothetical protein